MKDIMDVLGFYPSRPADGTCVDESPPVGSRGLKFPPLTNEDTFILDLPTCVSKPHHLNYFTQRKT